jgi:sugar-specific transcriptional regulator TrmB
VNVSPQAVSIYKQLKYGSLSAQEIGEKLGILPNAVYRSAKELINLGVVERVEDYPVRFRTASAQKAQSLYLQAAIREFRQKFAVIPEAKNDEPAISIIKDRESLLKREDIDVRAADSSINFIVSGLEVPDSTVLAFRKAATMGVKIRSIVQQKRETSPERLENWRDLGAQVKYLPNLKLRLVVIDNHITYLTSYDPKNKARAFGIRFDYAPFALQMNELFEQHWQKAQPV